VSTGLDSQPNPWLASLFSAVIPGAGHIYAGERERGRRLIIIDLVMVALLIIGVLFFKTEMVKVWASLSSLSLLMVANILLLSYRGWAAYDAYNVAADRTSGSAPVWAFAVTALVWLVVLVPHAVLGYYNLVQYSLIDTVFADTPDPVAAAPDPPPDEVSASGSVTTTTVPGPVLWDGLERLNVLLLGADSGAGRKGIRTDTMMVLSIDPETGNAVIVSIPRNYSEMPLPEGIGPWECNCFPRLVNDLWFEAEQHPDDFPGPGEPGPTAMKAAFGELLGLDIHYYALVTLDGFIGLVDALGGVTIEVPNVIIDEEYPHEDGVTIEHVVIEEGTQTLDGHLALAYARIRRHANDYARMNRQRCVIGAVLEQSSPVEILSSYGALAEVIKDSLLTDIPQESLVDLVDLLPKVGMDKIGVIAVNRDYQTGVATGRNFYDAERIKAETQALIVDPSLAAGGDAFSLDGLCS